MPQPFLVGLLIATATAGSVVGVINAARAGLAKCLLLTTAEDNPNLPSASGLDSIGLGDHAVTIWWGMIAPNGIPEDRFARIQNAFVDAARTDAFRQLVESQGATYHIQLREEVAAQVHAEYTALGEVAQTLGLLRTAR